ncbi:MAG: non-homologous end-joining DNA ligase [Candidatus Xenobia bacterium]
MAESMTLTVENREIVVTNPQKLFFPEMGLAKLDLVKYYVRVGTGALRHVYRRPMVLKRFPNGVGTEPFYQKRAPSNRPPWIQTATITFPSGRTADEVVVEEVATLAWVANLGCLDLNPWAVRIDDVDHPDELRVDLDPTPEAPFSMVRDVALGVREVLTENGLVGWPKTSGSHGIHINVRIEPRWDFSQVRRAALALAREVARRMPAEATAAWWKAERHGVFIDYNQNARDRTVASAYSVRNRPDARVSTPITWDELPSVEPAEFTMLTVPERFEKRGDLSAGIDGAVGRLDGLLELSARQEASGEGDAPWPPHYPKAEGEPPRVAPERRRKKKAT